MFFCKHEVLLKLTFEGFTSQDPTVHHLHVIFVSWDLWASTVSREDWNHRLRVGACHFKAAALQHAAFNKIYQCFSNIHWSALQRDSSSRRGGGEFCRKMTPESGELHVVSHSRATRHGFLSARLCLGVGAFVSARRRGALKGEGGAAGERTGGFGELPGCGLSIRPGGLGARWPKRDVQTHKEGESNWMCLWRHARVCVCNGPNTASSTTRQFTCGMSQSGAFKVTDGKKKKKMVESRRNCLF